MAKSSSMNPMEAERRRQRAKELKKIKDQKQARKLERLKTMDPQRIERRIGDLEMKKLKQNGHLGPEERILEGLKKDLVQLRKLTGDDSEVVIVENPTQTLETETETETETVEEVLGKRSVFYDPEWNPFGKAPDGFPNVTMESIAGNPHHYDADPRVLVIPLPEGPLPKFYNLLDDDVKTTYESNEQILRPDVKVFVPTSVKRKIDQV